VRNGWILFFLYVKLVDKIKGKIMGQQKRDFDFTVQLFNNFFSQDRIQKGLNVIKHADITGWEIWWQVEFATYLSTKDEMLSEWYREWEYPLDERKNKKSTKMFIDFLIRQKRAKKNSYIALELKQHIYAKSCIRKMLKDVEKVFSMKESASDIRSFWNVGIYREKMDGGDESVEKIILEDRRISTDSSFIRTEKISNTGFYYTIF
jgi:hypothetical protein